MYKKGAVIVGMEHDNAANEYEDKLCIHLDHSCGQWIIGGPEEARLLISDLWVAIKKMEESK